jgi:hypothetical protein
MKRYASFAPLACLLFLAAPAAAQTRHASEPESIWHVQVEVADLFASPLGQLVVKQMVDKKPEKMAEVDQFVKALGFDPRTEIKTLMVYGNGFEPGNVLVQADMGGSTGNLEGWILAAPGYQSEELDANTLLHSVIVDESPENQRLWCALPKSPRTGQYRIVASFDKTQTIALARGVLDGTAAPFHSAGKILVSVAVNDLSAVPLEIDADDPGAGIVKILQGVSLSLASVDDSLSATLNLQATSPVQAKQISQLLEGIKAAGQLAKSNIDEDAQQAVQLLSEAKINYSEGDRVVSADFSAPLSVIEQIIESR